MAESEFSELREVLQQAALGSYLVIPLKYEEGGLDAARLARLGRQVPMATMDLNEPVKDLLNPEAPIHVGACYEIPREALVGALFGGAAEGIHTFYVHQDAGDGAEDHAFDFHSVFLYLFHTQVALLCLGIRYDNMDTLLRICNPGYAENSAAYSFRDSRGERIPFSLDGALGRLCAGLGLTAFFSSSPSMLLEANTYNLAVVSRQFRELETMRQITFNQHRMTPLDVASEDQSEADVRYVYAVRNQSRNRYRWGCCVSSQSISHVVANEDMDFDGELLAQAQDELPLLAVALYEKYTCLRFTQLITAPEGKKPRRLRQLKRMMLEFRAYGTVSPANVSRWHNVKQIYGYIVETNAIEAAIDDIQNKLTVLIERQREIDTARNDTVAWVLTLFGIVSILASILSIIQILSGGGSLEWFVTIMSSLIIFLLVAAVLLIGRRRE